MKTAVTVLQEMMVKMGLMPEYECISQTGPQHQALFEYRCVACGEVATAAARSKKEAKQEVARAMLQQLAARGHPVPPPFGHAHAAASNLHHDELSAGCPADTRSYVALLKELCTQFRLAPATYELVGDTGPPHLRHFSVRAAVGQHHRQATATTKKAARQLAAEKLYTYLRENLARLTKDFDEQVQSPLFSQTKPSPSPKLSLGSGNAMEEALARAHDKAMERFDTSEEHLNRPDLGQAIADYHLGLVTGLDEESHGRVTALLEEERARESASPERVLSRVAAALRLELSYSSIPRAGAVPLTLAELGGSSPDLAFEGNSPPEAALAALGYVRLALGNYRA